MELKTVPSQYRLLLTEINKCTPVSIWLPSYDNIDYKILKAFLLEEHNVFDDYELTSKMTNAFPIVVKIIKQITTASNCQYLPATVSVTAIFLEMINLRNNFNKLARKCAVPRVKPNPNFKEPQAEVYPNLPIHTQLNTRLIKVQMKQKTTAVTRITMKGQQSLVALLI